MAKIIRLAPEEQEQPLLNDKGELLRRPTGVELHELLRAYLIHLYENGELAETTLHKLCEFADSYVREVDEDRWEDDEGGDQE